MNRITRIAVASAVALFAIIAMGQVIDTMIITVRRIRHPGNGDVVITGGIATPRISAMDGGALTIGGAGVQAEPVITGRIIAIDAGSVLIEFGVRTAQIGNPDAGTLQVTGAAIDAGQVVTGRVTNVDGGPVLLEQGAWAGSVSNIDGGYVNAPFLDAGLATMVDRDLTNVSLPTCTTALDTHWRGTILGDYMCVGALGKWFRYNPIATTVFPTGNEPGTFKGPAEGIRFFIDPPAPVAETFRCYSLTATVNATGSCTGLCGGLPVGQQIARLAVGQDIAGNLCYVDIPCAAARETVLSPPLGACGADAGSTGVRTFFWYEPTVTACTETPVSTSRIVCNITDS